MELVIEVWKLRLQSHVLRKTTNTWDNLLKSPFCQWLLGEKMSSHFLEPKFMLYNGTGDPIKHLYHYRQIMMFMESREGLLRQVFLANLQGPTLVWFYQLLAQPIQRFAQLCNQFLKEYVYNTWSQGNEDYLFNVRQNLTDPLRKFI